MRSRLLCVVVLALLATPVAVAQEPTDPDCTDAETRTRAMDALRDALGDRKLPARAGRSIPVSFVPCRDSRVRLRVRHADAMGPLLARADRRVQGERKATLRLRTTREVERRRGQRLRFHLRVVVGE